MYNGRKNNLTGNIKSDEWYTPTDIVNKCYEIVDRCYGSPQILCPFDTEESNFVKIGRVRAYKITSNCIGNLDGDYDLILTNPPFSINSFEMFLETKKPFIIICPETFVFSVKFFDLLEKYKFHYKIYSPKKRIYFIDEKGNQNRPNFHTIIIHVDRSFTKNEIEHFIF